MKRWLPDDRLPTNGARHVPVRRAEGFKTRLRPLRSARTKPKLFRYFFSRRGCGQAWADDGWIGNQSMRDMLRHRSFVGGYVLLASMIVFGRLAAWGRWKLG